MKIFLFFFALTLITGCKNQPSCSDQEAQKLAVDLVKKSAIYLAASDEVEADFNHGTFDWQSDLGEKISKLIRGLEYPDDLHKIKSAIKDDVYNGNQKSIFSPYINKVKARVSARTQSHQFENVRIIDNKPELKKCICEAELTFSGESESTEIDLTYEVQLTEDGNIYVEIK
ncbi:MAG: hypothetical protein RIB86_05945 [Imperialibacter sp.]